MHVQSWRRDAHAYLGQLRILHCCRNIDKAGGLDRYILTTPPKKLDSDFGEELREQLLLALQKQGKQPLHLPKAAQAAIGASIGARQL